MAACGSEKGAGFTKGNVNTKTEQSTEKGVTVTEAKIVRYILTDLSNAF